MVVSSETESENIKNANWERPMQNSDAYFSEKQIQQVINYWWDERDRKDIALFFLVLYRTGRRVSEILGKPPYSIDKRMSMSNYKGLRPIDIKENLKAIEFDILKKNHIKKKTKAGVKKSEDRIKKEYILKAPKRVIIPIDDEIYNYLTWYIEDYNIAPYHRLFKFSYRMVRGYLQDAIEAKKIIFDLGTRKMYDYRNQTIKEVKRRSHLHMFRHSFAIHFLQKNHDNPQALVMLKRLLEHSKLDITEFYLQFNTKAVRDILNDTWVKNG